MKNLNSILTTLFVSFIMVACGGEDGGQSARSHGGDPRGFRGSFETSTNNGNGSGSFNNQNVSWGQIYDYNHSNNAPDFQSRVEDFLSPQLDRDDVGDVNGTYGNTNTGIFFFGRDISFSSTPRLNGNNYERASNVFNERSAELRIEVEDLIDGERGVIPIHFNEDGVDSGGLTASLVQDDFIQLVFEDEFGKVSIEGVVFEASSGEILYQGDIWYKNLASLREGSSLQRLNQDERFLGGFTIDACDFFDEREILNFRCN